MNIQEWIEQRVEFGVGRSFASQLKRQFAIETGEKCCTPAVYHALVAVAKKHGIEDCDGGFQCRIKTATLDEQKTVCEIVVDSELETLLKTAKRQTIETIIDKCRGLLSESDFALVEQVVNKYI
jgi:hypothetical protein